MLKHSGIRVLEIVSRFFKPERHLLRTTTGRLVEALNDFRAWITRRGVTQRGGRYSRTVGCPSCVGFDDRVSELGSGRWSRCHLGKSDSGVLAHGAVSEL